MPVISLLATGNELLDGRVRDIAAQLLGALLEERGLKLTRTLSCGDNYEIILQSLEYLTDRSDIIIMTGGLGPTDDDLTREAVARFLGLPLVKNEEAEQKLLQLFERRKRPFLESNRRQAFFPEGASVVANDWGTAPGFSIRFERSEGERTIVALPGVPHELEGMLRTYVIPELAARLTQYTPAAPKTLKFFGLPEALIGERVSALTLDTQITVGYRAHFPEVHVKLSTPTLPSDVGEPLLQVAAAACLHAIGEEFCFGAGGSQSITERVASLLVKGKQTISVAESCTGGLIATELTTLPGSSQFFRGGVVSYSNESKIELLGLREDSLRQFGAVSSIVAEEMALGALRNFQSDLALSVTGIAGPDGGSEAKPVGTFFVGFAKQGHGPQSFHCFLRSDRERIRQFAKTTALDVIRRACLGLPPIADYVRAKI